MLVHRPPSTEVLSRRIDLLLRDANNLTVVMGSALPPDRRWSIAVDIIGQRWRSRGLGGAWSRPGFHAHADSGAL